MTNLSCYMDDVMGYENAHIDRIAPAGQRCQGGQGQRETTDCNLLRKKTIPDITVPTGRTAQAATVMEMRRLV